jgi:hypothetical protein
MTFYLSNRPSHFQSLLATGEDSGTYLIKHFHLYLYINIALDFKILAKNERGELFEHKAHKIIIKQSPYFKGVSSIAI